MKLVRTFGRGAAAAEALIKSLEQRGALNLERVEPVVREILGEVRRRGDEALREYAGRFDSLGANEGLLVSRDEMKAFPGIGEAYSKRIIEGRPYTNKSLLVSRGIIPAATYAKIKDQIIASQPKK